ncbi:MULTISPECIES: hypothetical protein [Massilia]|uniref:DUF3649 domain-containing protein n=2 Tax=Massilia TaxID=149698 RepID=A0ABY4A8G0_9BURK|nr:MULTISPECIES: hypothetical protein [Massilia]NHZ39684.1 hypothetical protein [Massilia aquatica]UOD28898.1 hypothetical protein INH39_26210 [Massilia violaceinigra]
MTLSPPLQVCSRLLAAVAGGYAVAAALAVFLGAVLPMARAEAVLMGTYASFAAYTAAIVWAFSPQPLARVWLTLALAGVVLGGAGMLLARGGSGA